jgi:hypothetical protein
LQIGEKAVDNMRSRGVQVQVGDKEICHRAATALPLFRTIGFGTEAWVNLRWRRSQ